MLLPPAAGEAGPVDLLWLDLRQRCVDAGTRADLPNRYRSEGLCDPGALQAQVAARHPRVLCFEFDQPDQAGLKALQCTLRRYPALPVLMLTEHHSERLAVWAFRAGVWDYLVKPVSADDLGNALDALERALRFAQSRKSNALPPPLDDCAARTGPAKRTSVAVDYIETHTDRPIPISTLARLCRLSESEFSRLFRREQGVNCREFLLQARMARARRLLAKADASIAQVAFAVGFNDPSHFTRMFRHYVGMTPQHFRLTLPRAV